MTRTRQRFDAHFKAQVAVAAVRGEKPLSELASQTGVHPHQITQWKKKALEIIPQAFSRTGDSREREQEELIDELYRQIGQLKVELDWVKKKSTRLG